MNKKLIRLTESDLHRIVKESVKKILRESQNDWEQFFIVNKNADFFYRVDIHFPNNDNDEETAYFDDETNDFYNRFLLSFFHTFFLVFSF